MEAARVRFDKEFIYIETKENIIGKMPLSWFPRLQNAKEADCMKYELWANGEWIHWEEIGEDLSAEGFFTYKKELSTV